MTIFLTDLDDIYFEYMNDTLFLSALKGDDTVYAGVGGSFIDGDEGNDFLIGGSAIDQLNGGVGNDLLDGREGADILQGASGNDIMSGGLGSDRMEGGTGNDIYYVESLSDILVENAGEGIDTVFAGLSYELAANIENLFATGAEALDLIGNSLANNIVGNDAPNRIVGGAGADRMEGKRGNDTYFVDSVRDVIVEVAGGGRDRVVLSTVTVYTLPTQLEDLTGNVGGKLTGNSVANHILVPLLGDLAVPLFTNDTIDGGLGADTMQGGFGNDTYVVENLGDTVIEVLNAGIDTVKSSVTQTLSANVENLILTGSAAISGFGNELQNRITGNNAANSINGGNGFDTLIGGLGADTYFVDTTGDVIIETGIDVDSVIAFASYTLPVNVENLTLSGFASDATGNASKNKLTGNAFSNILDGKGGADDMRGGGDGDLYVVDNAADVVVELAGQGLDEVWSSISYTLGANVEDLTLVGSLAINGTGNTLKNLLRGNGAANVLNGGVNADFMEGAGGNDTYIVDNVGDTVTESASQGIDTVNASVNFTLGDHVENLNLTGASAIRGTGNNLANKIVGNGAANTIDGKQGANTLTGGLGKDVFVFTEINAVSTITDFKPVDDTFRLSDAAFGGWLTPGAPVTLISGAAPVSAGAVPTFLYNTGTGRLSFDTDGTGVGNTPVLFLILTNKPVLTTADFQVVA
jgi:trimeric autotransporter adhesin